MIELHFRQAKTSDLKDLVSLLGNDKLGANREDLTSPLNENYRQAFSHIESDQNNQLVVIESNGQLVGMLQLTFIPYLTHQGSWRCLIEGVARSSGLQRSGCWRTFFSMGHRAG